MKTIAYVVLNQFAEWEMANLAPAVNLLAGDRYKNCFVSISTDPVESLGGIHLVPDADFSGLPDAADVLVLVGGEGWKTEASEKVEPVVRAFAATGKPMGAICAAVGELALCGLLNDRPHTGNGLKEIETWAGDAYTGSEYFVEQQAVRDGNLVTANGTASLEFTREMLRMLGVPEAEVVKWYAFYKDGFFPAGS